jgi:hypothetical protein
MLVRAFAAAFMAASLAACGAPTASGPGGGAKSSSKDYCDLSDRSALFLIDRTTVIDPIDKTVILESLGTVVDSLQAGDRLVIATIEDHYAQTALKTNACKPGCPPATGAVNAVIGSCSVTQAKQDARKFNQSLAATIKPLLDTAEEKPGSDIIRTIAQWTNAPPGDEPFTDVYIFSDMLENSQLFKWSAFKAMPSDTAMAKIGDMNLTPQTAGARVRIVGFGRGHGDARQPLSPEIDAHLRQFWTTYFNEGGARPTFEGAIRD